MTFRILVLDTETSGLGPKDGPCEIAWVELDDKLGVIGREYSLIDPQVPITASASGVHGIVDEDVADAPTLNEYFETVLDNPFLNDNVLLIAHNVEFDAKFLGRHMPNMQKLDTLRLARHVYPDAENFKLQTLRYELKLNIEAADAHSALGDVEVCLALLRRIVADVGMTLPELGVLAQQVINVKYMMFGKHSAKPGEPKVRLSDVPYGYRQWLLKNNDDADLLHTLRAMQQ